MKISMDFNLKDDMLTEARRIFELHDEKKQGFISIQSFKNIVKDCIPFEIDHDEENLKQLIAYFDPHDSGVITLDDFIEVVSSIVGSQVTDQIDFCLPNSIDSGFSSNNFESNLSESITELPVINTITEMSKDLQINDEIMVENDNAFEEINNKESQRMSPNLQCLSDNEVHFEFTPESISDQIHQVPGSESFNSTASSVCSSSSGVVSKNNISKQSFQQRNTWLRSSLRRSGSNNHSAKRLTSGSQYPNNQLSSPNGASPSLSSRRSSLSCDSDEMVNEQNSLEEDMFDLNQKIQNLQEQVSALTESQVNNDSRYTKVKQENANLLIKIHSLEEQLRELEFQSEERRQEDQRLYKDAMARQDREKSKDIEQYMNRIYTLQQELLEAKDESRKFQNVVERLKCDKKNLEEQLNEKSIEMESLREEIATLKDVIKRYKNENCANNRIVDVLNQEITDLRSSQQLLESNSTLHSPKDDVEMTVLTEMEQELKRFKDENRGLREANEELQAQLLNNNLEKGRLLVRDVEASSLANEIGNLNSEQLRMALKDQQDVTTKLRAYIDNILLNIVENYPQLLEVKNK